MVTREIPFSKPSISDRELEAVERVLASGWLVSGPQVERLEAQFAQKVGSKHAVAVSTGTAGMHLMLMALGIGPGDEVITPSLTWVSTINLITLLGATPVFVDVDADTLMIDAAAIADAITPQTKVIIPVHYAGAPLDLEAIYAVAHSWNIPVVEDAAHACGAIYQKQPVGSRGTAVFSFHATKNMTCGEGGMVVTEHFDLAEQIRILRNHGLSKNPATHHAPGRHPKVAVVRPGLKYGLSDLHASIGLVQLDRLDSLNARRAEIVAIYKQGLSGLPVELVASPVWPHQHAHHLFPIRVDPIQCGMTRDAFMEALRLEGIACSIHFLAVHEQPYYRNQYAEVHLPQTSWNAERLCSLPLFPDMDESMVLHVINTCRKLFGAAPIV